MPDTEARDSPAPDPVELPEGRLVGRVAFADAVRQAIGVAASQAWPMLWLVDDDFADWPLDEPAVQTALGAWLRQGGRQSAVRAVFALQQDHAAQALR